MTAVGVSSTKKSGNDPFNQSIGARLYRLGRLLTPWELSP
jgi:hypothetical protein